ncbi:hypothetical protein ACFQ9J_28560 [Streptomyces sp. NPDC056529]|uniref:hypothetical protein n=1 Tax=Streptomyces sp. NPDC056529 TaxID=3345855 RepID=UPI0036A3B744
MTPTQRLHTTRALLDQPSVTPVPGQTAIPLTEQATWARTVACCPHCQVTPGTPCHTNGTAIPNRVHARRLLEAKEMTT